jgi:hypothetical protein
MNQPPTFKGNWVPPYSLQKTATLPEYPQRLSIADVEYVNCQKPETWSEDHFECWQREQVAYANIRVLRVHIQELRKSENDCTRSHPHEEMNAMCELRTEIARLKNELKTKQIDNDTVDRIAVNLVREGINKHRARDLAVHFIGLILK